VICSSLYTLLLLRALDLRQSNVCAEGTEMADAMKSISPEVGLDFGLIPFLVLTIASVICPVKWHSDGGCWIISAVSISPMLVTDASAVIKHEIEQVLLHNSRIPG
jgi:hypothetical protein